MLQILARGSKALCKVDLKEAVDRDALWYDLLNPDATERNFFMQILGIAIPSLEEVSEIEESSRLYEEGSSLYMTAFLLASADTDRPASVPVTFILTTHTVLTVRYVDLKVFSIFNKKIQKNGWSTPEKIFVGLLDTVVERLADILEINALVVEKLSNDIFKTKHSSDSSAQNSNSFSGNSRTLTPDLHSQESGVVERRFFSKKKLDRSGLEMRQLLTHIGMIGNLNSKVRESLTSLDRLLIFSHNALQERCDQNLLDSLKTVQKDVHSLSNYDAFLFSKIEFLLEATMGLINIEQNSIIKFFSVAAVIFLPPMVVASIYGMNFKSIPELNWVFGYPFALLIMILSATLPYLWFKRKGWI